MKTVTAQTRRKIIGRICGMAALPLLSSCGTIIYPARVNQQEHGGLDPVVVIFDGAGLFLFLVPGIIAFVVDFGTGAIYYPAGNIYDDPETTIFDEWRDATSTTGKLDAQSIERFIAEQTLHSIKLDGQSVLVQELGTLDQFHTACRDAATRQMLAQN